MKAAEDISVLLVNAGSVALPACTVFFPSSGALTTDFSHVSWALQVCNSAVDPRADVSSQGFSTVSPCPTTQPHKSCSSVHPVPHIPGLCSPTACTARCSLTEAAPKSLLLPGVTTCCCSQGCTLPRQEPQEIQQGEVQSPVPACSDREVGEC